MFETKKILLLEDEYWVIEKFVLICKNLNESTFQKGSWILLSLVSDPSFSWTYNLEDFSAIFVDRDNALSSDGNFHKKFLEEFTRSSGNLVAISKNIFPMSWSALNNDYLTNSLIKIMIDVPSMNPTNSWEYYINNREEQQEIELKLKSNYLTKSIDTFESKATDVIKNLVNIENKPQIKNITLEKPFKLI